MSSSTETESRRHSDWRFASGLEPVHSIDSVDVLDIYIYAVKLLSGPSLAILGVFIWAK